MTTIEAFGSMPPLLFWVLKVTGIYGHRATQEDINKAAEMKETADSLVRDIERLERALRRER